MVDIHDYDIQLHLCGNYMTGRIVSGFFFPEDRPLLMDELKPFSDRIESIPGEFMVKWGMATQSTQEIRAIVLLQ